jgi:hypothetical protein
VRSPLYRLAPLLFIVSAVTMLGVPTAAGQEPTYPTRNGPKNRIRTSTRTHGCRLPRALGRAVSAIGIRSRHCIDT